MLKTLHRKTWQDLKAHRRQFLAVWLVIFMGTAFYGAMYPAGINLMQSVYNTYDQLAYMDYQVQYHQPYKSALEPDGRADWVKRNIPGVTEFEERLVLDAGVQLDPGSQRLVLLQLISVPDLGEPQVNRSDVAVGQAIQADDEVLLLKRFADYHGLQPGDELVVWVDGQRHVLRIAGLAFNPEYLVGGRSREAPFPSPSSFGVAWLRHSQLGAISGKPGTINQAVLRVDPSSQENLSRNLQMNLGVAAEQVRARTETASGGVVDANIRANFPILASFSALFLAGTLVTVSVLMGRIVEGDRQRIGTLRALGVRRSELVLHYLSFGLLLGLTGGLAGSIAGYFASFSAILPFVDKIAGGYLPGFVNEPQIPFILAGWFIVTAGVTLASAYPAWVESGAPPGIALRPPTPKSPSAVSRLPLRFVPLVLRQALRNLLRVPGRSLSTALGVMAGTVMVISSFVLIDSIEFSFSDTFNSNVYDLRVIASGAATAQNMQAWFESIPGVQAAQTMLVFQGKVSARGVETFDTLFIGEEVFDTIFIVVEDDDPFLELTTLEGEPAFSRTDGVWIGHNLARVLGVQVGDQVTFPRIALLPKQATVLGIVSQTFGSPVFVPRTLWQNWFTGKPLANVVLLRTAPGDVEPVHAAVAGIPYFSVEDYASYVKDVNNYLDYWRQMSLVFGVFGWLLTLAVIANTVSASLHERQGELAILRSLGVSAGEIARVVLLELFIMAGVGIAIGVPLGRMIGSGQVHGVDMDFYGLVTRLFPSTIVLVVFSLLLVVGLAALPGLRAVQRTDLGQVSKSQSI